MYQYHKLYFLLYFTDKQDRLKFLQKPLPTNIDEEADFSRVWLDVMKVIDPLHLSNHRRPDCKIKYNPQQVWDVQPNTNFMICEQTFSWLGMYLLIVWHVLAILLTS